MLYLVLFKIRSHISFFLTNFSCLLFFLFLCQRHVLVFASLPNSLGLSRCYQMLPWPPGSEQIIVKLQNCCNMSVFHEIILVLQTNFYFQKNWEHEPPKERALEVFHPLYLYKVFKERGESKVYLQKRNHPSVTCWN